MMKRAVNHRARCGGFAVPMALGMLLLVAVALVCLAGVSRAQLQRTRNATTGAQLRQMLLAGTTWVTAQTEVATLEDQQIPLPADLAEGGRLSITRDQVDGGQRTVRMQAELDDRRVSQHLVFVRSGGVDDEGRWSLSHVSSVSLDPRASVSQFE